MIDVARTNLESFGDRVSFVHADLAQPLAIEPPVDAVISTATFHWVRDHDALFANLAAVMNPGAPLVAQFGGQGNIERAIRAIETAGVDLSMRWTYPSVDDTKARLERLGYVDVECWLHDEPTPFPDEDACVEFLRTVILREQVTSGEADEAVLHAAARALPDFTLDYVRLNVMAVRA
jgi:trans-aconitate 2-methyltransferase